MDERRHFFELLPFYVNGTLDSNDLAWMRNYLLRNPQLQSQVAFQEGIRDSLKETVRKSLASVQPDLGLVRVIARIRATDGAPPSMPSKVQRFLEWLLGGKSDGGWRLAPALLLALAVIGVQGVLLMERQAPTYSDVRGPRPALADGPLLRVSFRSDAREVDIRLKLIEVRALIVAGPTRLGDYYLKTAPDKLTAVKAALDQSGLVQGVDEVAGLPEEVLE